MSYNELVDALASRLIKEIKIKKYHKKRCQQDDVKKRTCFFVRRRYFIKNDIYHPELNCNGTIEKRYKREVCVNHI